MAQTGEPEATRMPGYEDEDPAGIGSDALTGPDPVPAADDDEREIDPDGD